MNHFKFNLTRSAFLFASAGLMAMVACAPINPLPKPTLNAVRSGTSEGPAIDNTRLGPAEIEAEVVEIDRANREIHVVSERGRNRTLPIDLDRTLVTYHGFDYAVSSLEAGDLIAYQSVPRDRGYLESIRIVEPVQARTGSGFMRPAPGIPRTDVVEGRVQRIEPDLGVFDLQPRVGDSVTVSIPYNARTADIESFRRLRRGDYVRVEGRFVSPDSLQLLSFLSPRGR